MNQYVNVQYLIHGSDSKYAGDVRWMTVDTDAKEAVVHYSDVGEETEGVLTTATW